MRLMFVILKMIGAVLLLTVLAACVQQVRNSGQAELPAKKASDVRLATYNVHYIILSQQEGPWSVGGWEARKGGLDAAFKALDADIIAFQEMESFDFGSDGQINLARDWLIENNPGYIAGASGDARVFPSTQPVFFRSDRFSLLDQGWFFFSDTPDVIYSRTFNGSFPAFASWVSLSDSSGHTFRVVNVHFEFSSGSNRRKSAALVAERTKAWIENGETVFLLGDLNARLGAETLQILEAVGYEFAPTQGATYHLNQGLNLFGAIDHIAVAGGGAPQADPIVLRQKFNGIWPTDHYPVVQDYQLDP